MNPRQSVALVTGAGKSTGSGFEVAGQLAAGGMKVILTARAPDAARARAADLAFDGLDIEGHAIDVTAPASVDALVELVDCQFGRLDVLVNNAAGVAPFGELAATADLSVAREVMEATLFGSWRMAQRLCRCFARARIRAS